MLDRGLLAPLSPLEEVTLRRVVLGIANPAEHADQDLEHLKALLMIEEYRAGSRLTSTGKKRFSVSRIGNLRPRRIGRRSGRGPLDRTG
jgi:hypothetical protein